MTKEETVTYHFAVIFVDEAEKFFYSAFQHFLGLHSGELFKHWVKNRTCPDPLISAANSTRSSHTNLMRESRTPWGIHTFLSHSRRPLRRGFFSFGLHGGLCKLVEQDGPADLHYQSGSSKLYNIDSMETFQ